MRLLHSQELKFSTFHEPSVPPYAILSHTWGADEDEVTFQDMQLVIKAATKPAGIHEEAQDIRARSGFAKIDSCRQRALRAGYGFVWIDTCCIDKSSSAELSEAINSMYRWYKESRQCFVYLADVVAQFPPPAAR
jgi:Heterokaryon incompatibility protein (HET)